MKDLNEPVKELEKERERIQCQKSAVYTYTYKSRCPTFYIDITVSVHFIVVAEKKAMCVKMGCQI